MTGFAPAEVAASLSRALWGEVSIRLRGVQFRTVGNRIDLRFLFDGNPDDGERDSIGFVGAEVAADFPGAVVSEEVVPMPADSDVPRTKGWHIAYARKEATLAR